MFRAPAETYDRFMGRYSAPLAAALVDFAAIEPGMRALDVGCGPGALATVLVTRLGPDRVAAVVPSEPFVQACRLRLPEVEVLVGSADALPFADGRFDAVLAQLVVNFIDDPPAGVAEMRRVACGGGLLAACVWDYGAGMTLLRAFWDAAREIEPQRAAQADEGAIMRWCGEGELAELWRLAGLDDVRSGELVVSTRYADFDDLWSPLPTGVGPAGAFCTSLNDERQRALHAELKARLGAPDGPFELSARAWAVTGRS